MVSHWLGEPNLAEEVSGAGAPENKNLMNFHLLHVVSSSPVVLSFMMVGGQGWYTSTRKER